MQKIGAAYVTFLKLCFGVFVLITLGLLHYSLSYEPSYAVVLLHFTTHNKNLYLYNNNNNNKRTDFILPVKNISEQRLRTTINGHVNTSMKDSIEHLSRNAAQVIQNLASQHFNSSTKTSGSDTRADTRLQSDTRADTRLQSDTRADTRLQSDTRADTRLQFNSSLNKPGSTGALLAGETTTTHAVNRSTDSLLHMVSTQEWPTLNTEGSSLNSDKDQNMLNIVSTQPTHSTQTEAVHSVPVNTTAGGYIAVLKIYEQQTMATGNLLQLQCWANSLNLAVVKPFMVNSCLRIVLDESKLAQMMRLDDTLDIGNWNEYAAEKGYAPLADWNEFINHAPRKVIAVQLRYPLLSTVKAIKAKGIPFPHPPKGDQYKIGCPFKLLGAKSMDFLKSKGFTVVRRVCFNFMRGDELPLTQFHKDILGHFDPSSVTIIMDEWRGLGETQRVLIQEKICREKHPFREQVKPSQKLVKSAERYVQEYLGGREYLAVIARFEMTGLTQRVYERGNDSHAIIPFCLQLTLDKWHRFKRDTGLNTTFLSIDIGKYGSISFERKKYYGHLPEMMRFVTQIYGGKMAVHEWERTFEAIAQTTDSGYVAMLQQTIVTRAKCILFVGGGTFQRHAYNLYRQLHPNPEDQCVRILEKCTSPYRPIIEDLG